MIYLKQVKLLDPDLVAGDPEELKYPYKPVGGINLS